MGRRLGDLGKLLLRDNSMRLDDDAENKAQRTAGGCEHGWLEPLALGR